MSSIETKHLDWTKKQGRILTCAGKAEEYYTAERGFDFDETELPHHHLLNGTTRQVFRGWRDKQETAGGANQKASPIAGAWKRALFYGGWEHSTDQDEYTFNLQTNTLFIDLRIPVTRNLLLKNNDDDTNDKKMESLEDLTSEHLRLYARQHIFAGYSRRSTPSDAVQGLAHDASSKKIKTGFDDCCTRHHCIDWNFVGKGRTRPNKWWIDLLVTNPTNSAPNVWKEWGYATDEHGQQYYCERWERLEQGSSPVIALCKANGRDGILIVVGDHFNYVLNRNADLPKEYADFGTLVDVVDAAIDKNDLEIARAWLGLQGGHGRISNGWKLDHCIEFWREGSPLWGRDNVQVQGEAIDKAKVIWNKEEWNVFECSLESVDDLRKLLQIGL